MKQEEFKQFMDRILMERVEAGDIQGYSINTMEVHNNIITINIKFPISANKIDTIST